MNTPPAANNDKLMGLLAYLIAPIGGIIILVSEGMKNNPMLKQHAVQGIALAVVEFVISIILTITVVGACLVPFLFIPQIVYGIMAYQGKDVTIPVISDFCKKQGWF